MPMSGSRSTVTPSSLLRQNGKRTTATTSGHLHGKNNNNHSSCRQQQQQANISTPHQCEYVLLSGDKLRSTKTVYSGTCKVCKGSFIFKFSKYDQQLNHVPIPPSVSSASGGIGSLEAERKSPTTTTEANVPRPPPLSVASLKAVLSPADTLCVNSQLQIPNIEEYGNCVARELHRRGVSPYLMYASGSRIVDLNSLPVRGRRRGGATHDDEEDEEEDYDEELQMGEKTRWDNVAHVMQLVTRGRHSFQSPMPPIWGIEFTLPFVWYLDKRINTLNDWLKAAGEGARLAQRVSAENPSLDSYTRAALLCYRQAIDPEFVRLLLFKILWMAVTFYLESGGLMHQDLSVSNVLITTPAVLKMVDSRRCCAGSSSSSFGSSGSSPSSPPPPPFDIQSKECFQYGNVKFWIDQGAVVMMFDYGCAEGSQIPNPQSYMEPNAKYGLGIDDPFYDPFYCLNSLYSLLQERGIDWDFLAPDLSELLAYVLPKQLRGPGVSVVPNNSSDGGGSNTSAEICRTSSHPCFDYRLVRPESCTVPLPDPKSILFHSYFAPLRVPDSLAATLLPKYVSEPRVRRFRLPPSN